MKKVVLLIAMALFAIATMSQGLFSYQAVVRDASNQLVVSETIGMQISIVQYDVDGEAVYTETQMPETNANGLLSIAIGNGVVVSGDLMMIDWSDGPYFIKTEIDLEGSDNYTITGITQLLAVPYAMHALTVENVTILGSEEAFDNWDKDATDDFSGDYNELSNQPDFTNWDTNALDDFDGDYSSLTNSPDFTAWDTDVTDDFSGSYNDLSDLPANLDVDATDDFDGDYSSLTNSPDFTSWDMDVTDDFSGSYSDLTDLPINLDIDATDDFSGSYNDLSDLPVNLDVDATDDFSGDYDDLVNLPTIPTNVSELNNDSGYLTDFIEQDGDATNELELPLNPEAGAMCFYNGTAWVEVPAAVSEGATLTIVDGVPAWVSPGLSVEYAIGDYAHGGIVAYILQPGDLGYVDGEQHGLVISLENVLGYGHWGFTTTDVTGSELQTLGGGAQNTLDIINFGGAEGTPAHACNNYLGGGYSDWFLPSSGEANKLGANIDLINTALTNNGGSVIPVNIWTSTEKASEPAMSVFYFNSNTPGSTTGLKTNNLPTRAMRAF